MLEALCSRGAGSGIRAGRLVGAGAQRMRCSFGACIRPARRNHARSFFFSGYRYSRITLLGASTSVEVTPTWWAGRNLIRQGATGCDRAADDIIAELGGRGETLGSEDGIVMAGVGSRRGRRHGGCVSEVGRGQVVESGAVRVCWRSANLGVRVEVAVGVGVRRENSKILSQSARDAPCGWW
jgi:hypothetical protein